MLERVWRKGSPPTLSVGLYIDTATIENIWMFLKKLKIEPLMTQQFHSWAHLEKTIIPRHMQPNVHCITIYNSQDMEAT